MACRAFTPALVVLSAMATVFFIARLAAKRMKQHPWRVDDLLLLVALFFMYMVVAASVTSVAIGHVGYHHHTATERELQTTRFVGSLLPTSHSYSHLQILWLLQFPHAIAITLVQCSLSLLFIRLFFPLGFPILRFIAHSCITLSVIRLVVLVTVYLAYCQPISRNWSMPLGKTESCFPITSYAIVTAVWTAILDIVIWSLPHFVVWSLQLRLAHKVAITAIFTLGLLNIIIATFRITSLIAIASDADLTYDAVSAMVWTLAQDSTAIMLACCPLLRPVFEKMIPVTCTKILSPRPSMPSNSSVTGTARIRVHAESQEDEQPIFSLP